MEKDPDMSANLDRMSVQWQPLTMLEVLFTQLEVGQKFAAHHDAIYYKTILRMAIENIRKSGMLYIALRDWALQTTQSSWADFTVFMYNHLSYPFLSSLPISKNLVSLNRTHSRPLVI